MGIRKLIKDSQWAKLEPLMAGKPGDVGRTGENNRLFLEAVLWIMRTGSPWRDLPIELVNWHTTYTRFTRWSESGRWQMILDAVSGDKDLEVLQHLRAQGTQPVIPPRSVARQISLHRATHELALPFVNDT